ncbi:hypothetical protein AJ85_02930 [Alkalihalobacillus alcalophilus ATCC 27647 = CGMCC 1.3604]|uniref:Spore coat protein n=1 Tax=Alkalihalobacillus alcalophilus ATCC 27647 = CGMCC 1.3604 TaxID=1218173 RepID=A0A094XF05_ALKAL|nr:hypothetical protein [Alkalihalobacillus alcalophilus]KGA97340.1 hypothetical protein BALCAV_0211075 [Alkalihalobacillus alcalophilus ATCC 27647 = CGMCC 1.3604]MED1561237.1 hypothetical protein [Alkalihalobacillus alcalophilus]THG91716.1 hypothetical protein AJ85_02930 [Alkalihalobacillus alcalophilus ATCC 27647 = CGMCC 1.3604]
MSCGYGYGDVRGARSGCDCDTFFRHVARNQYVKVYLKASKAVEGYYVESNGNEVTLFDFDEECHTVITICCDDIVSVAVSQENVRCKYDSGKKGCK